MDLFLNANRNSGNTEALWTLQNELNVVGGEGNNLMRRYWVNRYNSAVKVGTKTITPWAISEENGGRGLGRFAPTLWQMNLYGGPSTPDERGSNLAWTFSLKINNTPPPASVVGNNPATGAPYKLGEFYPLDRTTVESIATIGRGNIPNTRKFDYAVSTKSYS